MHMMGMDRWKRRWVEVSKVEKQIRYFDKNPKEGGKLHGFIPLVCESPKEDDDWSLKKCVDDEDLKWKTDDWKRSGKDKVWEFSIRSKIDWKDYDETADWYTFSFATAEGDMSGDDLCKGIRNAVKDLNLNRP